MVDQTFVRAILKLVLGILRSSGLDCREPVVHNANDVAGRALPNRRPGLSNRRGAEGGALPNAGPERQNIGGLGGGLALPSNQDRD